MAGYMVKRQDGPIGGDGNNENGDYPPDGNVSWWWSPTGMAVRYSIIAFLFATVLLFFVGGYWHAQRRMRKGLPPLSYHRWMVRTSYPQTGSQARYYGQYPPVPPQQSYGHSYGPSYGMEGYPPPPPAYNSADVPPPVYQPPPGATKAMADQSWRDTNRAGEGSGSANVPSFTQPAQQ